MSAPVALSAAALRVEQFELNALLEIRTLMADGIFHHDQHCELEKPDGFNMNVISDESSCGTTCCIGGWMFRAMERDRTAPCARVSHYVNKHSSRSLRPLFFPFRDENGRDLIDDDGQTYDFPWEMIPPAYALKAIDSFLTTGDPDWANAVGLDQLEVRCA